MNRYAFPEKINKKEFSAPKDSLEVKYDLPKEVRYCKICVISNQGSNSATEYKHTSKSNIYLGGASLVDLKESFDIIAAYMLPRMPADPGDLIKKKVGAHLKFGLGRATYDASQGIRSGDITREEGITLVKRFDGEFLTGLPMGF